MTPPPDTVPPLSERNPLRPGGAQPVQVDTDTVAKLGKDLPQLAAHMRRELLPRIVQLRKILEHGETGQPIFGSKLVPNVTTLDTKAEAVRAAVYQDLAKVITALEQTGHAVTKIAATYQDRERRNELGVAEVSKFLPR